MNGDERAATAPEIAISPIWQEFAMECLDNQQLSHCGHLDTATIVPGCPYCAEWVAHATHTRDAPVRTCDDCLPGIEVRR